MTMNNILSLGLPSYASGLIKSHTVVHHELLPEQGLYHRFRPSVIWGRPDPHQDKGKAPYRYVEERHLEDHDNL